ncbi:MAG: aldehyde dehydrogenase family protein, partial [Knoellia sp.]
VGAAAAEHFIPAYLELGGKDAAIVTADADLEVASSGVLWGSTANTGQSCMSLERVYVESSVADRFIERLVEKAERVTLEVEGSGGGDIGPFIDPRQADAVAAQLEDAVTRGATIRTGGVIEEHDGRRFLRPTIVTGVDHEMAVMSEETFGPVIPVMVVEDVEQAIELANATDYGLSGAVFAAPDRAPSIAARMLAGAISINDACLTGFVPDGEKQAFKSSGLGPTRMGPSSLRRFVRQRVFLTRVEPGIQPWWYSDDTTSAR